MNFFKSIALIVSFRAIVITLLAVLSTFLCIRYGVTADYPLSLIGTAIIFPIVFSIGGAYKRREKALSEYGTLKAHARTIFFASRDWLGDTDEQTLTETKTLLGDILISCRELFGSDLDKMIEKEKQVYRLLSKLSLHIKGFRQKDLASGEVSRCNQFLSKMIIAFENIKHIYQYRTPRTLRAYSKFFITILPIVYGPYFAHISKDFTPQLTYVIPILFTLVLVSLDNIQAHLENPFDQIGEDDIIINAEKFVLGLDH